MRTGLTIPATLASIKPLSLNIVDTVQNDYTKLLGQFPELTRPTTKGEPVKHAITHKIVTKGHPVFVRSLLRHFGLCCETLSSTRKLRCTVSLCLGPCRLVCETLLRPCGLEYESLLRRLA